MRFTMTAQMMLACAAWTAAAQTGVLEARWHESGFAEADDNYNAVTAASDGRIYYVLCAHGIETGARMFVFDPKTGRSEFLADLTEASGEKGLRAVPQGKSHVPFFEHKGKLYFATHLGYYRHEGGKELVGVPPEGYKPYPGGHFLVYDMATRKIEKLGTAPSGEGIITMAMDRDNGRLYGITWPTGLFISYDLASRRLVNHGATGRQGEKGTGDEFRAVCRTIGVEPRTGYALFTNSDGEMMRFNPYEGKVEKTATSLRREVFGTLDPAKPGHMGYNWRQAVWYAPEHSFYGVHGGTGYLMRIHATSQEVEIVERIASAKTRASGAVDEMAYGYLGLTMGPDGHTLYYLTGTPAGEEMRFVTYDLEAHKYTDHGALALADGRRPTWAQAIAAGADGRVYTVSKIVEGGKQKVELLSFADPLRAARKAEPRYRLVRSWLNPAGLKHPLKEAHSLCFDKDGNVIVVDSVGSRVHRFTPEGRYLGEIGGGDFKGVRDARVSRSGEIFVLDTNNYRIQVFSHEGRFLRAFGEKGSGPGQMLRAHGLGFSPDGARLYVVDVDNNRVSVFEAATGRFLFAFGRKGSKTGEFREAHGMGVAPNGDVIVSSYYGPVARFTGDGKFLYEFAPGGFREWAYFHSMTTDAQGNTYLAARSRDERNAIVMYDSRGGYVTAWVAAKAEGEQGVKAVAVDANGLVYAAVESKSAHGVQVYRREGAGRR